MHLMLLAAGVLAVAVGVLGLLFGAANYAPGVGNTLILVGAVAVVGGVAIVGLAAVLSRLRRIHDTLESQMVPRAIVPASGLAPPASAVGPAHAEAAPEPEPPPTKVQASEPRPGRTPLELQGRHGENAPAVAPAGAPPPRGGPGSAEAGPLPHPDWPRVEVRPAPPTIDSAAAPQTQTIVVRPGGPAGADVEARESADAPGAGAPILGGQARDERPRPEGGSASLGFATPGSPTILKSGVVEGMAYTLYDDGSIEAEMPDGAMRFTSIAELRAHLRDRAQPPP